MQPTKKSYASSRHGIREATKAPRAPTVHGKLMENEKELDRE